MWTRTTAQGYWQPLTGTGELGAVNSDRNRERREVTVVMARKGDDWGETWAATGTMPSCSGCIAFDAASAVRARPPFCGLSALRCGPFRELDAGGLRVSVSLRLRRGQALIDAAESG